MSRRSDHSREQIREMALATAEHIVVEEGFNALSARKIAKNIGYTVGTLYLVFKNIEDLIIQTNARTLGRLEQHLQKIPVAGLGAQDRILALGDAYYEFARAHEHLWTMVFEHRPAQDTAVNDQITARISNLFAKVEEELVILMPDESPHEIAATARALWCGVHGVCSLAISNKLLSAGKHSAPDLIKIQISCFLNGLEK